MELRDVLVVMAEAQMQVTMDLMMGWEQVYVNTTGLQEKPRVQVVTVMPIHQTTPLLVRMFSHHSILQRI